MPFDGIWIDMNEPSVFSTNDNHPWYYDNPDHPDIAPLKCPVSGKDGELDNPPYKTWASYLVNRDLCDVTLCMFAQTNRGKQTISNVKSLYGLRETISTNKALKASTGKRGQVSISNINFKKIDSFSVDFSFYIPINWAVWWPLAWYFNFSNWLKIL